MVADNRWLRAIGERFAREPDVVAVTGLMVPLELETQAQVLFEQSGNGLDRCFDRSCILARWPIQGIALRARNQDGAVRSIYLTGEFGIGCNMAFRKEKLLAVGGFDEALGVGTPACGGEDIAVLLEMLTTGNRLAYEPNAIIQHSHRATLAELEQQIHGYGIGFTALLTAITLRNPWHALGLAAILPAWLLSLRNPSSAKNAHRTQDYPRTLARAELLGMLRGSFAYMRSRRAQRRWRQ